MRWLVLLVLVGCHPPPTLHREDIPLVTPERGLPCTKAVPAGELCDCLGGERCSAVRNEDGPLRYVEVTSGPETTVFAAGPRPGGWGVVARLGSTSGEDTMELDYESSEVHVIDGHRVVWLNVVWHSQAETRSTAIVCVLGDDKRVTTCPFRSLREHRDARGLRTWNVAMAVDSGIVVVEQAAGEPDHSVPTGRFRLW